MKCKVCSYDHSEFDRLWVDRAMQGKCEELEAKLAIAIEALKGVSGYALWRSEDAWANVKAMADQTIAKINEVPE